MSQAFSTGFAAYLENFLARDSNYDLSFHFAPSTPGFLVDFKAKHVAAIAKAKEGLEMKIAKELEALKQKKETRGEEAQGDKDFETTMASPTETTAL